MTSQNLWKHLYEKVKTNIKLDTRHTLDIILTEGTLSTRILKAVGTDFSEKHIKKVYSTLAGCLENNTVFIP